MTYNSLPLRQLQSLQNISQSTDAWAAEEAIMTLPKSTGAHSWLAKTYIENNIDLELWPAQIRNAYVENEIWVTTLLSEYENLSNLLSEQKLEHAPLKGILLAQDVLPYPGLRPFCDVDIWVSPEAYANIDALMKSAGFECMDKLHHRFHFHKVFRKNVRGLRVTFEIHQKIYSNDFFTFDHEEIWTSALRNPSSSEIKIRPEHQLIYTFCHNSIHSFDRLSRFLDLVVIYRWACEQGLSHASLMTTVTSWKCRRVYLFSLLALEWLLEKKLQSQHFEHEEVIAVNKIFTRWRQEFIEGISYPRIPLRTLADSRARALLGTAQPKRILGALVDRLGIY